MEYIKRALLSFLLLTLFMMHRMSITMFTRMHYVDSVTTAHSHPYKGTHLYSTSSIVVIVHSAIFRSLEAHVRYDFTPEWPVLFTVEVPESIPMITETRLRVISSRAPPTEQA